MSCLCIGGVCIPYTALLPLLIIGLQWMASQLAKIGLLPDFVAKRLGLLAGDSAAKPGCGTGCCSNGGGGGDGNRQRRGKRSDTVSTASSSSSSSFSASETDGRNNVGTTGMSEPVEHVTNLSRYQEIITSAGSTSNNDNDDHYSTLIIKFTAEWCKPCKSIQPTYLSLASKYSNNKKDENNTSACATFISVDVDGDECDTLCTRYKIVMMPTFICLRNGKEMGRMTGGGEENGKKLCDWVKEMVSS